MRVELVKLATYLLDDIVEEATRELSLDLLLEPPVRGEVRDVNFASGARAASENSDDATPPIEDNRARISTIGKLAVRLVVG